LSFFIYFGDFKGRTHENGITTYCAIKGFCH
jgi:hypothetical protein